MFSKVVDYFIPEVYFSLYARMKEDDKQVCMQHLVLKFLLLKMERCMAACRLAWQIHM